MENGRQNPHHHKAWLVTITFSLLSCKWLLDRTQVWPGSESSLAS